MSRISLAFAALLAGAAVPAAVCAQPVHAATQAQSAQVRFDTEVGAAKAAMMSNPDVALAKARSATAAGRSLPGTRGVIAAATGRWLEGEALARLNRPEHAKPIVADAIKVVSKSAPNSKLHADLLKARASIAALTGEVQVALRSLHDAHKIYTKLGEARSQAIVLQNIGSIYQDARDFPRALRYLDQAEEAFSGDPALSLAAHNNRGTALKEMAEFAKAEAEFREALKVARLMDSPLLEARIITNIASAQLRQNHFVQADATVASGFRRASGAAAEWRPFLWGVKAQIAQARGDAAGAVGMFEKTFSGVEIAKSTMLYRDFHESARYAYEALGRHQEALAHLAAHKRLDDEAREVAVSTSSALMGARFDAANQELRIAHLKAEQAQRGLMLARSEQRLRNITLFTVIGGTAALIVIGAVGFAFMSARRSRREVSAANAQLTFAARHDALTGLGNRAYFRELLGEALSDPSDGECALLLIDLDRFKLINDTFGHNGGDELLREVARRLLATVDSAAYPMRLGGDEFAVMVGGRHEGLDVLAERIIAALSEPYQIEGSSATVGATVGIAVAPADANTIDGLTRSADLALYRAKENGRGRHCRYEPWMQDAANERRLLESDLREALAEDRLSLAYQPIVDAQRGEAVAYEALLRWNHPTRGEIPPSVFVPIAEEARLINQIGAWVLRSACAEAAHWPEHVKVAVNLSALQLEADSLTSVVVNALAANDLRPERLELEMTESVFLREGDRTEEALDRLRMIGVSLALDDFGMGYSSLGYLQRASFSSIKIDRSFVKSATGGCPESVAIIQAIIALARGLGMETTAEGIETESETAVMRELGCTRLQGYLFGEPSVQLTRAKPEQVELPPVRRRKRKAA